jgi:hypothetical protein
MSKPEYHRLHMRTDDGDHVTAYLPLKDGQFAKAGPQPYLLKALWDNTDYYGELKAQDGSHHRIEWEDTSVSLTDLGKAPLKRGAVIRIFYSDSTDADFKEFVVIELARV